MFKCIELEPNTFFLAVELIDSFLDSLSISLSKKLLHLVCISAIYIASKYYDLSPLGVELVAKELGHNEYSTKQILEMERKILEIISFRVPTTTILNEVSIQLKIFATKLTTNKISKSDEEELMSKVGFISKMIVHSPDYYTLSKRHLSLGIIRMAIKQVYQNTSREYFLGSHGYSYK